MTSAGETVAIEARGYANPDFLVSTEWVADHLNDPMVRLVESNEDPLIYPAGHIPGAAEVDWTRDLNDPMRRDFVDAEAFATLLGTLGVTPEMTLVFYGDKSNWWAAYAFWVFQLFAGKFGRPGQTNARLMDGGRLKWEQEGRPMTREIPQFESTEYPLPARNDGQIRAVREDVLEHVRQQAPLVDVRTPEEFRGERLHMPDYPNEGALRGGHIPGARNVSWARVVNADGTFKSASELQAIYTEECGLSPDDDVVTYCRIGERSSHTWFVLKYLLGFKKVRNYDGSWTEWGNLVGMPIAR